MTLFRYLDINRFSNLKFKKCIFVGYSEDVKGYRLLQPHSHDIIIRRDVKFDENLLAWEPNLEFVPSMSYEPNSTLVPSSTPNFLDIFLTPYGVRAFSQHKSLQVLHSSTLVILDGKSSSRGRVPTWAEFQLGQSSSRGRVPAGAEFQPGNSSSQGIVPAGAEFHPRA